MKLDCKVVKNPHKAEMLGMVGEMKDILWDTYSNVFELVIEGKIDSVVSIIIIFQNTFTSKLFLLKIIVILH